MASLVDSSDPRYKDLEKVLTAQKKAVQNAFRRKGEHPKDLPPRAKCITEFQMASLRTKMAAMQGDFMMLSTVIGIPYPPSTARLQDLQKLMIRDLKVEINHRGFYLLLRFLCPAMRMTGVMNVVEDEAGTVSTFALYLQEPETVRSAENILKEKNVIILKEPYFKVATNGSYVIRVDQPTDIVRLSEDDPRIPPQWRNSMPNTAEHWKKQGNDLVAAAKFYEAIDMYSKALRSSPSQEEREILLRNRALAYLRIEAFDAALEDISSLSDPLEKGLYRKGLALYGLGRFKEALEVFQILVKKYPDSTSGKHELKRCHLRVAEQESGRYDFVALDKATALRPPCLDAATYRGPIEVRESDGRGRGLFTTRAVKSGELLLCEKAFSYCYTASLGELAKTSSKRLVQNSCLIDVLDNRTSIGNQADLIRDISTKLTLNPSLKPVYEDLYHGNYEAVSGGDGLPVVDTFLVAKTIRFNSFGCPLTSKHSIINHETDSQKKLTATGIWILASYINHSCDETCQRTFIGDMQIIRAGRNLPAGTELTFSYVDKSEPGPMNKRLLEGWGFECNCARCKDDRATPQADKVQKRKLIRVFNAASTSTKRKLEIVDQLGKLYPSPPSKTPRFEMWDLHMSLVEVYAKVADTDHIIEHVLAAFSGVGFVIDGAKIDPFPSAKIVVKRWGAPHRGATSAWLTLRNVYKLYGLAHLAEQTKEFARITWLLIAGEDTTFVYDNPPNR